MDDASSGNTFEQEKQKQPTPPWSPWATQDVQPWEKVSDTLNDVDQTIKAIA